MTPDLRDIMTVSIAVFLSLFCASILVLFIYEYLQDRKPRPNVRMTPSEREAYKLVKDYERAIAALEQDERLGRRIDRRG